MKGIVKTCLVAVALFIGTSAYAQLPVQFGVNAGMNLSNVSIEDVDTKAKIGFQVGVTVDYNITPELFLQSGLSFTTKGTKLDLSEYEGVKIENPSINAMYLQLPIRVGYRIPVTDAFKINFNAGPYLAYGLGGKTKIEAKDGGSKVSVENDTFGDDGMLKRFDFGLGFGVGAEVGKININLGYELGLANIAEGDGADAKNRNAFLTVGYKF